MAEGEQAIPGNGTKLAVHDYQLVTMLAELRDINGKLDKVLPRLDVHDQRLNDMNAWRTWASGIGGSMLLTMIGLLIAHVVGGG